MTTYMGWANHETWIIAVHGFLDDFEPSASRDEDDIAQEMETYFDDVFFEYTNNLPILISDLLGVNRIDWREHARHWLENNPRTPEEKLADFLNNYVGFSTKGDSIYTVASDFNEFLQDVREHVTSQDMIDRINLLTDDYEISLDLSDDQVLTQEQAEQFVSTMGNLANEIAETVDMTLSSGHTYNLMFTE